MERIDYSKLNYEVKVEGGNLAPEPPVIPLRSEEQQKTVEELKQQNSDLKKQLDDYKALTEERFNKLVNMITQK
jgi:hypothetical protein